MSVLTTTRRSSNRNTNTEAKPFDGCWINVGIIAKVEQEDGTFVEQMVKLPLGIPVATLKDRKIYDGTNPEYAEQSAQINAVMDLIRNKALSLESGESAPMNLAVEVYRKQDEAETAAPTKADSSALEAQLFG